MSDPPLLHVASALVVGIDDPLSRWRPHSHGLGSLVIDASSWLGAQLGYVDSPCGFSMWILHVVWASLSIMVPGEPGRHCKMKSKNVAPITFY